MNTREGHAITHFDVTCKRDEAELTDPRNLGTRVSVYQWEPRKCGNQ